MAMIYLQNYYDGEHNVVMRCSLILFYAYNHTDAGCHQWIYIEANPSIDVTVKFCSPLYTLFSC